MATDGLKSPNFSQSTGFGRPEAVIYKIHSKRLDIDVSTTILDERDGDKIQPRQEPIC